MIEREIWNVYCDVTQVARKWFQNLLSYIDGYLQINNGFAIC